jgi:hypothetical protein
MGGSEENEMICWLFVLVPALLVLVWVKYSRKALALTLVGVLAVTLVFPATGYAQLGLIGGIQNLLNLINGSIRGTLTEMGSVMQTVDRLHEQVVWPVQLIQQARSTVGSLIPRFRNPIQAIHTMAVRSATLPAPINLEAVIRNRQTNDMVAVTQTYYQTFGALPAPADADPIARNLIDADDAMAVGTLKALKASDRSADLILQSGNNIEDEARLAAPGSAPFLTASSVAANIQSQAMMQKMLAAMIRQEAARIAHENSLKKRYGLRAMDARQGISDLLKRR